MIDIFRDPRIIEYDLDVTIIGLTGKKEEGEGSRALRGFDRLLARML